MQNTLRYPLILYIMLLMAAHPANAQVAPAQILARTSTRELARQLKVGDIVFIHVDILPFRHIARDTGSWTNHVGIVIDTSGPEPVIAESAFPLSKSGPLSKFVARSKDGRVEVSRLNTPLTPEQQNALRLATSEREGIFYDTGFNLHSRRQFCSRYVYEVVAEATGIHLGKVENFRELLSDTPNANLFFWRVWYFGKIPWERETVTPASLLNDTKLFTIFDGYAHKEKMHA